MIDLNHKHVCKVGNIEFFSDDTIDEDQAPTRDKIEPWLSALLQAEHASLLLGSGFTIGACGVSGGTAPSMVPDVVLADADLQSLIEQESQRTACVMKRGKANLEDWFRTAMTAEAGLRIVQDSRAKLLQEAILQRLTRLVVEILDAERALVSSSGSNDEASTRVLCSFLLSFIRRTATRDRLHIFTTNYDRLVEFVCDLAGVRVLDRFVGALAPRFRTTRLDIDVHYNPPGIRGEPRILGGVLRLSKLHGSIDWIRRDRQVERTPLEFGSSAVPDGERVMIFPNSFKDYETAYFPYAELFRDFAAAVVKPNSVLFTYGYGFGDDHINRILGDMLTLSSTHLVIISYDNANERIAQFVHAQDVEEQISLLMGPHYGNLSTLAFELLPQPLAAEIGLKHAKLLRSRSMGEDDRGGEEANDIDQ